MLATLLILPIQKIARSHFYSNGLNTNLSKVNIHLFIDMIGKIHAELSRMSTNDKIIDCSNDDFALR